MMTTVFLTDTVTQLHRSTRIKFETCPPHMSWWRTDMCVIGQIMWHGHASTQQYFSVVRTGRLINVFACRPRLLWWYMSLNLTVDRWLEGSNGFHIVHKGSWKFLGRRTSRLIPLSLRKRVWWTLLSKLFNVFAYVSVIVVPFIACNPDEHNDNVPESIK